MGERTDHTWAAKRVGVSVPRQNGKSQLLVSRALAGALLFGEKKIVVSAHQQDTARESFGKLMEIVEADENESLRKRIKSVMNALNREAVKFANGATIQFKARSGAAGKGFSSDCLLLDEAQILGSRAWTSINSTMSAMRNPQVWLLGTPPQDEDDCYAFEMVRRAAVDGKSSASAWVEWSADPDADDYDPASEYTRWQANPAWNTRINAEVVQGEFETYTAERFAQDRLGQWRSDAVVSVMPKWRERTTDERPGAPAALGVAVDVDRVWLSVAAASGGDIPHLAPVSVMRNGSPVALRVRLDRDLSFVASEVARIQSEHGCAVVLDKKGPAGSLEAVLAAAGVDVTALGLDDIVQGAADLYDAVEAGRMSHGGYPELDGAVMAAGWRNVGERRTWARRSGEISMLEAATLAHHVATTHEPDYDLLASIY